MVENGYIRWCEEKGVPKEILQDKRRFWSFLKWVGEMPHLRESLVKTGWASWEHKWKEEIFKRPITRAPNTNVFRLFTYTVSGSGKALIRGRSQQA